MAEVFKMRLYARVVTKGAPASDKGNWIDITKPIQDLKRLDGTPATRLPATGHTHVFLQWVQQFAPEGCVITVVERRPL